MLSLQNESTPLTWAATEGKIEVVKWLVKAGADVNCKEKVKWL